MVVEWSPHDTSLFAVGADNLRLFETTTTAAAGDAVDGAATALTTQRKRSFRLVKINAQVTQLKCMEWYPFESKPLLIAAGMGSGKVLLSDFQDPRSRAVREFVPKYSRPCNAVAWNKALPNQLAAGFEKVRSDFCTLVWDLNTSSGAGAGASTISGNVGGNLEMMNNNDGGMDVVSGSMMMGSSSRKPHPNSSGSGGSNNSNNGANGSGGGGGGARSFTRENEKPVHELSNSEATVALSWVPSQPMCLATGTGFKWLRVYDLRTKGVSSSPLSVVAHNKAVLGVVFDQHRPHILATYTDGPQEAVKVWDIRRLDSSVGPLLSLQQTSKTLAQVSWCPSKPGILVTTSAEEKWISLWDVTKHETADGASSSSGIVVKKPFRRRYTSDPLASFSWQYVPTTKPLPQQHQQQQRSREVQANANAIKTIASAAFPNRLLIASVNGEIEDISVHDSMPVTVSPHGAVAFSCGKLLFGGSLSEDANTHSHGTAAAARHLLDVASGERSSAFGDDEDISSEMYRLAKRGYSIELSKSLKLFQNGTSVRHRQLRNLWLWVDQVEALRRIRANRIAQTRAIAAGGPGGGILNATAPGPLRGWPFNANALVVAGVKNLLAVTTESPTAASSSAENAVSSSSSADSSSLANIASEVKTDPVLNCQVYEGLGRRLALLACNWDPDNGQSSLRNSSASQSGFESNPPPGPGRPHLPLNRSNSGAWASQKQFEDSTLNSNVFGNRSGSESGRHELRSILSKCESEGQYARAAALAVFHGDLNTAVSFLQKGAMWLSQVQSSLHDEGGSPVSHLSADVLQLVAMAVAGYSSSTMNVGGPSLWATMCQQLLKRDEVVSQRHPRYLHALLSFLCVCAGSSNSNPLNLPSARGVQLQAQPPRRAGATNNTRRSWGSVDGLSVFTGGSASKPSASGMYSAILSDMTLPLSDRVAFACRYLPADDLRAFVTQHEDECEQFGRLEGLILTGLNATGTRILQTYLDTTGDIQTLALLAARLPSSIVNQQTRPQLSNWIVIYQDLLNQWQLFHERARLDVGRSQLEDVLNGFANFARDPDGEELQAELLAPSSITVPPQLYVRCNFCNASLSLSNLLRQGGSHSSWLNRAKPKLTCCPSCRKPLPQCALCLLPFGSLNPYFELAHRRSKQIAEAVTSAVTNATMESNNSASTSSGMVLDEPSGSKAAGEHENLAQLSSIPFVEWFTWCQSCKHGGHAHHLADWFKSHSACPVTDCECQCQYLDLPIMLNNKQNEIIVQQQQAAAVAAAAAAAAAQRTIGSQSNKKQSHHHHQHEYAPSKRSGTKHGSIAGTPQQQAAAASSLTTSSSFRMLPPSRSTLGFQSKLSSSASVLAPGNIMNAGLVNLGGNGGGASSVNSNGSGSGTVDGMPMSMSMSLGNKLDQLEQKDKSGAYKYM